MSIQFATWGSNISGGFLRSTIDQETRWDFDYNLQLTTLADRLDFYAMLFPTRYVGRIGGNEEENGQLDPLTTVAALARATQHVHLISAVLPAFVPPVLLAKIGATIDQISNGRWHPNIVSGWFQEEQERYGIDWIEHANRYNRSSEYIEVLKGLWGKEEFTYEGQFYQIPKGKLKPAPLQSPHPAIFQGGNSQEAREMAGRLSDWYFMNGAPVEELKEQIQDVKAIARRHGRNLRFAVNAFIIARPTEEEAQVEYQQIVDKANLAAITDLQNRIKETKGMWSHSTTLSDFVANNEGFRTGLIGSYEQVTDKIKILEEAGIDLVLLTFRHPLQELVPFHDHVQKKLQKVIQV